MVVPHPNGGDGGEAASAAVSLPIYMDCQATTPLDPRVLEAMLPYFTADFGNAASRHHGFGWRADEAVATARAEVAALIGADAREIVFTSGATESDNLAVKGIAELHRERGRHIVTTQTEHKAVLDSCRRLEEQGYTVTYLPVEADGRLDPARLRAAMTDATVLVSVMLANNEVGTVHPWAELGRVVKERGACYHVDAAQGAGKVPFDVEEAQADLVSLSAHKLYGPKGIGALYVRRRPRVRLAPLFDGGGHERGLRSGTLNVPGIVGFGRACALARAELPAEAARLLALRERLRLRLEADLPEVTVNGSLAHRLPGNLNVSFAFVEAEALMLSLKEVALSAGAACTSTSVEPSYVLRALGLADELATAAIRFGLGRFNTAAEVDYVANRVVEKVRWLRELSPLWDMRQQGIEWPEWACNPMAGCRGCGK